ncbi:hypothetical protein P3X46_002192 [Hevea brasiliensis]|uniref:Uncharacterized protein n=1 Tax=Hevea brasiliensis TaxID=3981 RepID=A0ABQ9N3X2_HEVBR|nr:uncharacterized protein LOC110671648 [Hevea brasiliensis]KAJ9186645.1 hypothetical protein P3X46_002192 [Hevea brasiliensis]
MTTTRFLRSSRPLPHAPPPGSTSSSVSTVKCIGKNTSGLGGEKMVSRDGDKRRSTAAAVRASVAVRESLIIAEPRVDEGIDLASLFTTVGNALFKLLRPAVKRKPWKVQVQTLIEKAIIDCRFFTLFATVGALLSSVLCFMEGCFLILKSYFHYFGALSHSSDQGEAGEIVQLLIEAIDMFLVGTAMLIFGVGLHVIFVGSKNLKQNALLPGSSLFGLFFLKSLPTWVQMESVSQAKSRIGHAVIMILQVGLLEKFKKIPLVTSLDFACFAGAVLISSACIFILSKLSLGGIAREGR